PKAQVCSELCTLMVIPDTSAIVCIMYGDFFGIPPRAINPRTGIPSSTNLSTIALAPKQAASTSAWYICSGLVDKFKPITADFNHCLASGVLLPFNQSRAISLCSVSLDAASFSSFKILSSIFCANSLSSAHCSGQLSNFLNQAKVSPKLDCPASNPIIPGITEPSTCPQIPRTVLSFISSFGATKISQVEVPITLLR